MDLNMSDAIISKDDATAIMQSTLDANRLQNLQSPCAPTSHPNASLATSDGDDHLLILMLLRIFIEAFHR